MAFAPLDCWARFLRIAGARIGPRYWPRLAWCLVSAAIGTAATIHERVLLLPVRLFRFGGRARFEHKPGVVVIVGYFRSGTTHLHYLMSCDRRFTTPRWYHCVAPQGFWLSWTLFRFGLVPLLPNKRPQDDVAFGPEYPAEEDFGLCNWTLASSLPGRFVVPSLWREFQRWHFADALDGRERARFRGFLAMLCWKITRARPGRPLLLKSPTNTARVGELRATFGDENVRFVHLVRDPSEVVQSNAAMYDRLGGFLLEDPPPPAEVRARIAEEYERSELHCLDATRDLGPDRYARVRYQDLVADPVGQLRRVYGQLGLAWRDPNERALIRYLHAVRAYRAASQRPRAERPAVADPGDAERAMWGRLRRRLGLDEPTVPAVPVPAPAVRADPSRPRGAAWLVAPLVAATCFAGWLLLAHVTENRLDTLIWPIGALIGMATIRVAGRGSLGLGLWTAGLFLGVVGLSVWPMPEVTKGWTGVDRAKSLANAWGQVNNNYVWVLFGVLTAWRYGSREHVRPPGQ